MSGGSLPDERHRDVTRENDTLILDRLLGMLHELPRREREAVLVGCSFMERLAVAEATIERQRAALRNIVGTATWYGDHPDAPEHERHHALVVEVLDFAERGLEDGAALSVGEREQETR